MTPASGESPAPARRAWRGRRWLFAAASAVLGAALAGAYAYFIGCKTGTCPLTSSVPTASMYGSIVGLLVGWPGRKDGSPRQR
jgi:hypothetical protein